MSAALLKSQNGWPASSDRNAIRVRNYLIPGTKRHLACAADAAAILVAFAAEFHSTVEPIDTGVWDDWGYHFALIPGSKDLSNHCSGTAMDLNSVKHPWKRKGTFAPVKAVKIRLLCKKYGLRWGGDYIHRPDEMHFELIETPTKVAARVIRMKLPTPIVGTAA